MIDIHTETLLTLKQARSEFPTRPSISTLWRWVLKGARGSQLESIQIGGRRFTSKEAIVRFIDATAAQSTQSSKCRNVSQRDRAISTAKAILDQFGV